MTCDLQRRTGTVTIGEIAIEAVSAGSPAPAYKLTAGPDLAPRVFGYYELFHALTLVALACRYVAIAFFVVGFG